MQVHNELGVGHAERFYQRRLLIYVKWRVFLLKRKRVKVWVDGKSIVISNWIYGLMNDLLWNVNRFHIRLALMK